MRGRGEGQEIWRLSCGIATLGPAVTNAKVALDFLEAIPNYHDMNTAIKIFGDFLFRVSPIAGA